LSHPIKVTIAEKGVAWWTFHFKCCRS